MKYRRKEAFSGRLLKLFQSEKELPNGKTAYFEEIDHPGASLVIPYVKKKIILIRQYRGVIEKYMWELPAGTIDPGETPLKCAKREVKEETGYSVDKIEKLGYIYTTPGFCNEKIFIYKGICSPVRGSDNMDNDELIRIKLFTSEEVSDLFQKGKINDAKTIAALSFAGII